MPQYDGDFSVPTLIDFDGRLVVSTENNGARLYEFGDDGRIIPQHKAQNMDLWPDTVSPVLPDGLLLTARGALTLNVKGSVSMPLARTASLTAASALMLVCLISGICGAQEDQVMQDLRAQGKLISERGSTRATRYAVSNKIVTVGEKTHIAWLDSVSETMIVTFDHATGQWSGPVRVGTGKDNHGGPALLADSKGSLHIIFGPHGGPFQHAASARPNDPGEWVKQPDFGADGTYPSAVFDAEDTLHIIYRGGEGGAKRLVYQRKPAGQPWSDVVELAAAPIKTGYTHYHSSLTIGPDQSLHVSYDIYFNGSAQCAGHLMSRDAGGTWTLADGSSVSLPVTPDQDAFFKRSDASLGVYNLVCDRDGKPWISANHLELWHHDGAQWRTVRPALTAGITEKEEGSAGGAISINNEGNLHWFGSIAGKLWLLRSVDGGETFARMHVADPEPDRPLMGPNIERFTGHNRVKTPWLLYSAGVKGPDCYGHGLFHKVFAAQLSK